MLARLAVDLTPAQIAVLEKLLQAGFKFVTFERFARHLAVEKEGFVALRDPAEGKLKPFGQVGYRMGEGIGIGSSEGKAFVWHQESGKHRGSADPIYGSAVLSRKIKTRRLGAASLRYP